MRRWVVALAGAATLGYMTAGWAAGLDEATVVGRVSAAEHEIQEGYFSMGEETTLVARPGSELHRWLARHRGQKVRLLITTSREDFDGRDTGGSSGFPSGRP
jgi:hypothetical protein